MRARGRAAEASEAWRGKEPVSLSGLAAPARVWEAIRERWAGVVRQAWMACSHWAVRGKESVAARRVEERRPVPSGAPQGKR